MKSIEPPVLGNEPGHFLTKQVANTTFACRICGNAVDNERFLVREMQLGLREEFPYRECSNCGCLQIETIPSDLSKYYPRGYYSYRSATPSSVNEGAGLKWIKIDVLLKLLTNYYFCRQDRVGAWLANRSALSNHYPVWIKQHKLDLHVKRNSRILDVGCGTGKMLLDLHELGLFNLLGIDPFLEEEINYENGVSVLNVDLHGVEGPFDFIMFNHSFEHMPEPVATLRRAYELLAPDRYLMLRIPVAGSRAWREHGVNWVALDAPRHIYLHTKKSIDILASQAGFAVAEVGFDSNGFAHWGSELYRREIPLMDERSPFVNPKQTLFSQADMDRFVELDQKLNESGEADCAVFYLHKPE